MITELRERETLTLGGVEVPFSRRTLPLNQLRFYPENPRIYSAVYTGKDSPTQSEIEENLCERDHVRQLVQSIRANGGLIDPLILRDGDFVVLEGNSRLAACRMLARENPIKWGQVKCHVLDGEVDDEQIFSLLCQYHIIGRKDWAPYEQAGLVWRRWKHHGAKPVNMAKEVAMTPQKVEHLINVYSFMDTHEDREVQHWSYYDEYLKSRTVGRRRQEFPELDAILVEKIKSGAIPRAEDIRDKLPKIADVGGKVLRRFMNSEKSLDESYEDALGKGAGNALYRRLNRFRLSIADPETRSEFLSMDDTLRKKCKFELRKIHSITERLDNSF